MNLTELKQRLIDKTTQNNNILPLTQDATGVEGLEDILKQRLGLDSLELKGSDNKQPSFEISEITGSVIATGIASKKLLNITDCSLVIYFTLSGAKLLFTMAFKPEDNKWQLSDAFPSLADEKEFTTLGKIAAPCFVLTSYDHESVFTWKDKNGTEYSFSGLKTGLNLEMSSAFTPYMTILKDIFGELPSLSFQGMITDIAAPELSISAATGKLFGLGKVSLDDIAVRLSAYKVTMEDPKTEETTNTENDEANSYISSQLTLAGKFNISYPLVVEAIIPLAGNNLSLNVVFEDDDRRPNLDDLVSFFTEELLRTALPSQIKSILSNIQIKGFGTDISLTPLSLRSTSLEAGYNGSIPVIPDSDLIVFSQLDVKWIINDPFATPHSTVSISGNLLLLGGTIGFQATMPGFRLAGGLLEKSQPIDFTKLLVKFGLPSENLPVLNIDELTFNADTEKSNYSLAAELAMDWQIGSMGPVFKAIGFNIEYDNGKTTGGIATTFEIGGAKLKLSAANAGGASNGWLFEAKKDESQDIPIGEFIAYIMTGFGLDKNDIPQSIQQATIKKLYIAYNTSPLKFSFDIEGDFPIAGELLAVEIKVTIDKDANNKTHAAFGGILSFDDVKFKIDFTTGHEDSKLTAVLEAGNKLTLDNFAHVFGIDLSGVPDEIKPSLKEAKFGYDFTKGELNIEADSETNGKAIFISFKQDSKNVFLFGLQLGKTSDLCSIQLSRIPIIGDKLPESAKVSIDDIRFVLSSSAIKKESVAALVKAKMLPDKFLPEEGLADFFSFGMLLDLAGKVIPINLGIGESKKLLLANDCTSLEAQAGTENAAIKWINIQKSFGPVGIQKIGIEYKDNCLFVLMNTSLSAGGLYIGLLGLGAGSSLHEFKPEFELNGLAITFKNGSVEISGGLLGTINPINFVGELVISVKPLSISAFGGYAQYEGQPSFFLYSVVNYPIGGPSFFFITGLAAGFGFNRKLIIPDLDGVPDFPFVKWAVSPKSAPGMDRGGDVGKQVNDVLTTLSNSGVVAPSVGEYWLTFGIKFSSFKLVESFALLTVIFGTSFEIDVLGMSTLSIPEGVPEPIVRVELALKASFSLDKGLIAVSGKLTPNSYVLSKDCHLTGGFAFYVWFAGEHSGDFLITIGGYSPKYAVPSHYPVVPRLGLNWQVIPELYIKGELYFALTSNAVMAGGSLSAVWNCGCIRAWFDVHADFLMVFKPFHYYISAGVDLGTSFDINLFFTKVRLTMHLGVNVEIWGPDFTGLVEVDLCIIAFTIRFGSDNVDVSTTIGWSGDDGFVKSFLTTNAKPSADNAIAASNENNGIAAITVSSGLVKTLSDKEGELNYIVNAEKFELMTSSIIPSKTSSLSTSGDLKLEMASDDKQPQRDKQVIIPNADFGVGPTGTDSNSFTSCHNVKITSNRSDNNSEFRAVRVLQNVPKALWEKKSFDKKGVPSGVDPLKDTTINDVLVGYKIIPYVKPADVTLPIKIEYLLYTIDEHLQMFKWSTPYIATDDAFDKETVAATIGSKLACDNRSKLLKAMAKVNMCVDSPIDISTLSDTEKYYLKASPKLSLLGEEKNTGVSIEQGVVK